MEIQTKVQTKICIVGLGYVGLPLLHLFSTLYDCWGYDNNPEKEQALKKNNICSENSQHIKLLTSHIDDVSECNFYIIAVPTPVNEQKKPDISALKDVCRQLGKILSYGDNIVFESTVYPGVTEEVCIPILEHISGLKLNCDFSVGYSPERINIGDQTHQIYNTPKIISASNNTTLRLMDELYGSVIDADIIKASSIKVAEAAKMYENVQRDTLIALANEYSEYCRMEGIDIQEVTDCAATKWNFANVRPGLVGGHCIGVDAYYLLERSSMKGLDLPLVKTSRSVNENKVNIISDRIETYANSKNMELTHQKVLILGFSYKPNTADTRNTKIMDLINNLQHKFEVVDCYDPLVDHDYVKTYYGLDLIKTGSLKANQYDIVVLAVNHDCFANISYKGLLNISNLL